MKTRIITRGLTLQLGITSLVAVLAVAACTPAAQPSPTAAPAKPAPTTAPAKSTSQPAATAAPAKPAQSQAAPPAAKVDAKAIEAFYTGKTITIVTGYTPGGQYDAWSRLMAKYMPKYIPGHPSMVVENMAGAASLRAANHVYNVAPKDGTVIGNIGQSMILNQINGLEGLQFDMQQFQWLGAVSNVTAACIATDPTGIRTLPDMLPPNQTELVVGTSGPGSTGHDVPLLMNRLLGTNFKIISGYPANAEVRLAIEKGEVDGYCTPWEVLKPTIQPWIEQGDPKFNIFLQFGQEGSRHPEMPNASSIWEFIKTPEDKTMFQLLDSPNEFFWPFMVPPGVPAERVEVLRNAMAQAFKDPELIADATRAKYTMNPVPGEKIQALLKEILATPDPVKARFKELMKPMS